MTYLSIVMNEVRSFHQNLLATQENNNKFDNIVTPFRHQKLLLSFATRKSPYQKFLQHIGTSVN